MFFKCCAREGSSVRARHILIDSNLFPKKATFSATVPRLSTILLKLLRNSSKQLTEKTILESLVREIPFYEQTKFCLQRVPIFTFFSQRTIVKLREVDDLRLRFRMYQTISRVSIRVRSLHVYTRASNRDLCHLPLPAAAFSRERERERGQSIPVPSSPPPFYFVASPFSPLPPATAADTTANPRPAAIFRRKRNLTIASTPSLCNPTNPRTAAFHRTRVVSLSLSLFSFFFFLSRNLSNRWITWKRRGKEEAAKETVRGAQRLNLNERSVSDRDLIIELLAPVAVDIINVG